MCHWNPEVTVLVVAETFPDVQRATVSVPLTAVYAAAGSYWRQGMHLPRPTCEGCVSTKTCELCQVSLADSSLGQAHGVAKA